MAIAPDVARLPPPVWEPDWVGDAWRAARGELVLFGRTWLAFARAPRRTTCAWVSGEFRALNPLAYFINILAILAPYRLLWAHRFGFHSDLPFALELLKPALPFVATFSQALLAHWFLRLLGSKRRARSTVGALLYATGGWAMLFALVQWPLSLWTTIHPGKVGFASVSGLVVLAGGIVGTAILVVTLASLHGIRKRRAFVALMLGSLISGAVWMVPLWLLLGPVRLMGLAV
jgi:hypothetical protein